MTADVPSASLVATATIDSDHPGVVAFARAAAGSETSDRARSVRLYYAVRDGFRYDPYRIDLSVAGLRASTVLEAGFGWCVPKALLMIAACRALGIPARLGLADVRNHMSTERLHTLMGSDVFYGHGYASLWLGGQWVKATPAFNLSLCQKMRLHPLEFDGASDSIYHPFDLEGRRHMEYLHFWGEYDDLPREELLAVFARHYPKLLALSNADWEADVSAANAAQN